jgi:hypothetical protein
MSSVSNLSPCAPSAARMHRDPRGGRGGRVSGSEAVWWLLSLAQGTLAEDLLNDCWFRCSSSMLNKARHCGTFWFDALAGCCIAKKAQSLTFCRPLHLLHSCTVSATPEQLASTSHRVCYNTLDCERPSGQMSQQTMWISHMPAACTSSVHTQPRQPDACCKHHPSVSCSAALLPHSCTAKLYCRQALRHAATAGRASQLHSVLGTCTRATTQAIRAAGGGVSPVRHGRCYQL